MISILITGTFLIVALAAYVLFGGADFGGGILEATLPSARLKAKLQKVLSPVWEANHVWLIAVVVILFVGFPRFYSLALTRLYVPVTCALFAILIRGTFFTLRKYDPKPGPLARWYTGAFRLSSFLAPLAFGLVVAGLLSPHPDLSARASYRFHEIYIQPWCDGFALLCGVFIAALFGYVAAVFFYGELSDPADRLVVRARIGQFFAVTFILGGGVLALGTLSGRVSLGRGLTLVPIAAQLVAFVAIFILMKAIKAGRVWTMRFAAGAQVLAILAGWFGVQYPILLRTEPSPVTIYSAAAPGITLFWLNLGLVVVLSLVLPLLVVLFRVFRAETAASSTPK